MKIRRYVAKDMRSALAQIKEDLGVDAVIMSNKKIAEGVELMAALIITKVLSLPNHQYLSTAKRVQLPISNRLIELTDSIVLKIR
jgi:flagellar biosynthesis GTPase FlhF